MGWSAPALPLLEHTDNSTLSIHLEPHEASWVGGLLPLGALVGAIPAGVLAGSIGRRKALLWSTAPFILGWAFILAAEFEVFLIFVGRFIGGLSVGASTVLVPLYCEEIAEDSIRGALGAYLDFMLSAGILWIYVFGAILEYAWYTLLSGILPLIFAATFFWMPESPTFLVSKGRITEAEKSLTWLRNGGEHYDIGPEIHRLVTSVKGVSQEKTSKAFIETLKSFTLSSNTVKAFVIIFSLKVIKQFGGINAITFYTVQIFNDAGGSLSAHLSTIIMGSVETFSIIVSLLAVDRWGRRPLLLLSSALMAICLAGLSGYFYCLDNNYDIESWRWVPLASLTVYVTSFSLGIGPIPWFMMAELLPTEDKAWASALLVNCNWTAVAIITKLFPDMVISLGQYMNYAIMCLFCVVGGVIIALFVPETKGKSREEIQNDLKTRTIWLISRKKGKHESPQL